MRVLSSSVALLALSSVATAQAPLIGYVRDDESLRDLQGVELCVEGSDNAIGFESFEIRRAKGFGKFIDSVELKQAENRQLADLVADRATLQILIPSTATEAQDTFGGDDGGWSVVAI